MSRQNGLSQDVPSIVKLSVIRKLTTLVTRHRQQATMATTKIVANPIHMAPRVSASRP